MTIRCQVGLFPAGLEGYEGYFRSLSTPHPDEEVPPITNQPPTPEFINKLEEMNRKFGISFH